MSVSDAGRRGEVVGDVLRDLVSDHLVSSTGLLEREPCLLLLLL